MPGMIDFSQTAKAAHLGIQRGASPVTDLARWKAAHARPAAIDALRWNEAVEKITRANFNAWLTLTFIWPRVLLRAAFGV